MIHRYRDKHGTNSVAIGHGSPNDSFNALRYIVDAYDDEPLFVIRGRDRLAVPAVLGYSLLSHSVPGMVDQVTAHLERFKGFALANPELMKFADPHPGWPSAPTSGPTP